MNPHTDALYLLIPGDIETRTGGYRYDKRILEGLRALGRTVELISLDGDYPEPGARDLDDAGSTLAGLPDGALVLIDALAGSVMAQQLQQHASRLRLVSLLHHPLALETGIPAALADKLRLAETAALKHVQRVITTSDTTAQSLAEFGVPAERVFTVCPGTDSAPLSEGSADETFGLLCVATLTHRKGHAVLLDALAQLRELPWQLSCAGSHERDAVTAQALFNQSKSLGLQDRVHFIGEVGDEALQALYHASDLFVLASYHEGYGMVLDEAIARGLPIVASNGGAMARTVPEGAGLLCPPGDSDALANALRQFMENPHTRTLLQDAARRARGELRSWQQASREFDEALPW